MIQFSEHYIYHPNQCQGEDSVVNMEMYFSPSTHSGDFCARIFSLYTEGSLIKMAIRCRYCKCLMYLSTCIALTSLSGFASKTGELQPDLSRANLQGDRLSHKGYSKSHCFPWPSIAPSQLQTKMCCA